MTRNFFRFAALCLLPVAGAFSQTAQPQKFGIIDMQSALVSTKDGQKAIADLKLKYGPRDQALQKRQQDLQAKQEQLRKTQNTISPEARATLERDIDSLTRNFQRDGQDAKQEMDEDQQKMVADLGGKIMQVLSKYAETNRYTLIFDVSGQPNNILFASNTIDITREIIALYDKSGPVTPTSK